MATSYSFLGSPALGMITQFGGAGVGVRGWKEGFPGGSDGKESACNAGYPGLIPGSGRSPGGEHGNPLQ